MFVKNGVTHTEGAGLTQTDGGGVSHTAFEVQSLAFCRTKIDILFDTHKPSKKNTDALQKNVSFFACHFIMCTFAKEKVFRQNRISDISFHAFKVY